jgi:two-component system sensor histidine kinase MtrB
VTRWRATPRARGLRGRLIIGFGCVSAVTAALAALASVVIRLMVEGYHVKHILFVALPAHISPTMTVVVSSGVVLIVLTIATAAALLAARSVLRPVGQLAQAAGRVASGDLEVRLVPEGEDELSRLVATFNAMTAQVQESVDELRHQEATARRFASDASHELRSPLAAMTAVTQILEDRAATMDAQEARATALVTEGITRLGRLVEDLLEISRFDAGTVLLNQETVRVADAVEACLRIRDWTDRVSVDVPAYLTVDADRRRLDVILSNLIGNALTHGAAPVEIRAAAVLEGLQGQLRVTVRDHGAGMVPEALTAVFDRFYKAEAARSPSAGCGLGLAIALENARLHSGSITASNAPGAGATFTLTLPRHCESTAGDDTKHTTASRLLAVNTRG